MKCSIKEHHLAEWMVGTLASRACWLALYLVWVLRVQKEKLTDDCICCKVVDLQWHHRLSDPIHLLCTDCNSDL